MKGLKVFGNGEFGSVRTAQVNNEAYLMLNDVCFILDLNNVSQVKTRLLKDGVITNEVIDTLGRKQQATFINESNFYKVVFQSRKSNAEKFTDWVASEVLPSIRKHGGYIADVKGETDEELTLRVMTMLQNKILEREKALKTANDTIKEQQPAVDFMESVKVSETSILIKDLATLLNQKGIVTGQNRLFKWMRENGYLLSTKGYYNKPSQRATEMKVLEYKLSTIEKPNGDIITTFVPLVTGKGIVYFMSKFLKE